MEGTSMGSGERGLGSFFSELQAVKVAQDRILTGTRSVLAGNERRLAEALAIKVDVGSAKKTLKPTQIDKFEEKEEAWVGYDVEAEDGLSVGNFYLGLYFDPVEAETGEVEIYAYGSVVSSQKDQRERLWRLVEGATSWDFERNKSDWSAELYRKISPDGAERFTQVLEEIVGEWCEIGRKLGGVERALSAKMSVSVAAASRGR
jgi:hypothetical protein